MDAGDSRPKVLLIKGLAIAGFIATVFIIAWLLFKAIQLGPSFFSSLASIIDSMEEHQNGDTVTVTTEKSLVNSGEEVHISFNKMNGTGEYVFTYTCTDGVSARLVRDGEASDIGCNEAISLPSGAQDLTVSFSSERMRFVDVPFSVLYQIDTETISQDDDVITIVNSTIPDRNGQTATTSEPVASNEDEGTESEPEIAEEEPVQLKPPASRPVQPKPTYVTIIPQSDPNGFTDLQIVYWGTGQLSGSLFHRSEVLKENERNAIKVEVKNIGTKTSDDWHVRIELPTGETYTSREQAPLKPNERAELTIGFEMNATVRRTHRIQGEVEVDDANQRNNSFIETISTD